MTPKKKPIIKINEEPTVGRVISRPIDEEVKSSYLDYAMSVIVSRALPDVRDGLKPVHRRILYTMWKMGLKSNVKYRKSATVIGEVLGKYHPHGDVAVYDALVRMAQDFSLRYPLVDGQGNFGSIDGDAAAAYRYTEAKLAAIAEEMLIDIEKEVVQFVPNYDGTLSEPLVLPSKLPNLLLNGALGIAVGMATNIPPHNLKDLSQAIVHLIDHPDSDVDDLTEILKGPDFPTGALIFNPNQIKEAYTLGKGPIVMRAKAEIVEASAGNFQIVVTEIPFQVNKSTLIERIADLVKDKKIEDIRDLRDESDREGIRIVIELKRHTYPQKVLNQLFKLTDLQTTFHVNMVALLDGIQPRLLDLKSILEEFVKHRQVVIKRRTEYDLARTRERIHILKGLKIAVDHIEEIIRLIKKAKDRDDANASLRKKYNLSEIQANAILDMRLHQLANLERMKIENELKEKLKIEKELMSILEQPKKILQMIKADLQSLIDTYGEPRRTQIVTQSIDDFKQEDLIPNDPTLILTTQDGYIKRLAPSSFKTQIRGGKGVVGVEAKEEDAVEHLISATTHTDLLFFTTTGRVFQIKAYDVPESARAAKGRALVNFLELSDQENVSAILPLGKESGAKFLTMVTANGIIKKTEISEFENVRRSGLIAIKLKDNDALKWVKLTSGQDEIILVTAHGQAIRFSEKNLRSMGRSAAGVRGLRLSKGDFVVGMDVLEASKIKTGQVKLLVVMENGFGKMSEVKDYRLQQRGGGGIKTAKITDRTGGLVAALVIDEKGLPEHATGDLLVVSKTGQIIRLPLKTIKTASRATQGVKLMRFKDEKDKVASVTLI
ncbi:MAG: DNA gyrase subunit A [Patescibacteria group bacterium]|nr:DNA gyrase subunit A [Patescibacteria group bacterium]MDD5121147.1 DNA gyrase subunit A [Patescibacteria group bacterium]MDD5221662.1 DNA gyrase subunit A [Patescibacteria group bacterium]MDD5395934.1 DNA gyrase subunit A [Patescibacteria group bacterium]